MIKLVMAAVVACKWRVKLMRIRVLFGPGLLAKEIRPRVRNPTHVMVVTWKPWLAVAAWSDHAPDVSAIPRM